MLDTGRVLEVRELGRAPGGLMTLALSEISAGNDVLLEPTFAWGVIR